MASHLKLEIVTPEQLLVETEVEEVIVPAYDGLRGLLPDHEPLVTNLRVGLLSYVAEGQTYKLVVGKGILEIHENQVSVLVEEGSLPESIDFVKHKKLRQAAIEQLESPDDSTDFLQAQRQLEEAEVFLDLSFTK